MKDLLLIQPNKLLQRLYPRALWHGDRDSKIIYLTFDDGPVPGLTEWVLDELKNFNAKASFFCVGDNVVKHPAVFERLKSEGHLICNHSMTHPRGFKTATATYLKEAEDCEKVTSSKLFRPPYGQLKPAQYKGLVKRGFKIVFWDVISYDFEKISPAKCAENVIQNSKEGSIVLFHDNVKAEQNLKHALPLFLQHFSEREFQFRSLEGIVL